MLPLMNDFSKVLGLETLLRDWGINPLQNFEDTFTALWDKKEGAKVERLQTASDVVLHEQARSACDAPSFGFPRAGPPFLEGARLKP